MVDDADFYNSSSRPLMLVLELRNPGRGTGIFFFGGKENDDLFQSWKGD